MTSQNTRPATDFDLRGFASAAALEAFFGSIGEQAAEFDILNVPPALWPNVYLLDVGPRSELTVTVHGEAIRQAFGRDLSGIDLRTLVHGEQSDEVQQAYDMVIDAQMHIVMRRLVHLSQVQVTKIIECGLTPLASEGRTTRVFGCLHFFEFAVGSTDVGVNLFQAV